MPTVDEPVGLVDYDERWPGRFAVEAARIRTAIAHLVLGLEHIGSTAVPGLAAKPIVDLMVGVPRRDDGEAVCVLLGPLGYERVARFPGRTYLRRRNDQGFNAQVVEFGGDLWSDNVALRDYLRARPEAAAAYARAKQAAVATSPMLLAYSELKRPVLEELLRLARESLGDWPSGSTSAGR